MGFICDKQPELRQAAAYGVGVMAKFGGEVYASTCAGNINFFFNYQKSALGLINTKVGL